MSLAWSFRFETYGLVLGACLLAAAPAACGGGSLPEPDDDGDVEAVKLEFLDTGTLELKPQETTTLELATDAGLEITLLLLGDAIDASLDASIVRTNADGRASVELTAPSRPTTFIVRAKVGDDASAELHVAVSEQGFTTLRVAPSYEGERELDGWSADVLVGGACEQILAGYPEEPVGALHTSSATLEPLTIESVPVGTELAVAVHSGAIVAGCVPFTASQPEGLEEVMVTLVDKPLALGEAELEVSLDYAPTDPSGYQSIVHDAGKTVADTAFPPELPVVTLILDEMSLLLPADAALSLTGMRQESGLDAQIAPLLDGVYPNQLCTSLADSGAQLAIDPDRPAQPLEGFLAGVADDPGFTTFELTSFGGLSAEQIGAPPELLFSWNTLPNDGLVISGLMPLSSTRLAAAYMNLALVEELGQPLTIPVVIAESFACDAVAAQIVSSGEVPGCDAACLQTACEDVAFARWDLAVATGDSLDGALGNLQIAISGKTTVSEDLLPLDLKGTWVGTLSALQRQSTIMGEATGQAPPPQ